MKVVILAGGYGTRISEESHLKPKPMIEIGDKPILWHIMKEYSYYGFNEFIICCGYKQHVIKEWFADYYLYNSDVTFDFADGGSMQIHNNVAEPWKVTLVDTGLDTMTGGRVKRIQKYVGNETFMLTYGDGVSDVNIRELYDFHKKQGKMITLTAISVAQRYGILEMKPDNTITSFHEKKRNDGERVNGGYMVCEPALFDLIDGDGIMLEREPLERATKMGQVMAYKHDGYWQSMDTKREKDNLDELWKKGQAPWKIWD